MFEFMNDPTIQFVIAVIVFLIILGAVKIIYHLNTSGPEHYTSGANNRFGTTFSSTNEEEYETGYNENPIQPVNVGPRSASAFSGGAGMRIMNQEPTATNQRPYQTGYNDQIENTLLSDMAFTDASDARGNASMDSSSMEHFDQESALANQLYNEGKEHMSPEEQVANELAYARGLSGFN